MDRLFNLIANNIYTPVKRENCMCLCGPCVWDKYMLLADCVSAMVGTEAHRCHDETARVPVKHIKLLTTAPLVIRWVIEATRKTEFNEARLSNRRRLIYCRRCLPALSLQQDRFFVAHPLSVFLIQPICLARPMRRMSTFTITVSHLTPILTAASLFGVHMLITRKSFH